ncbi:Wzz/FepE/Etk N-terminal domain-containing protein [Chitinophaga barathri]|uniref:Lipopolysaccharide biosynthesis protein n=1 Tax=Chitinophaga barathri TaxID=1647451 RepID=A0A3N4MLM8_9BACT|nr:Wzz/FepE/Etk N-terminal domain-containing protein [Chitinophaga barathri]RPD40489.1 lipopolysaccharide biosynthesis protein [Chitinophaga barathri]
MEPTILNQEEPEKELSIKQLILQMKEWIRFLWRLWFFFILAGAVGAGLGFTYAFLVKPRYIANLTFVLEENKSGGLAGYAGLASQFGIDLGSGSGSGIFAGDNIIEFLKSRLMVEKTLLTAVDANGKIQSLADLYITSNNLREVYDKKPDLKKISFAAGADRKNFTRLQDSILNTLYISITKKNLSVIKPDKKLSFIAVQCISPSDIFSKYFAETLVKEATDFYIQTKTKRSKTNVDKLQLKADSLETLLNRKTYSAAASQDLNLNPARSLAKVGTEVVTRDKIVLQTMYGEVVKNLELSRMSMTQETPIIQIVDTPILPLEKKRFGKLKGIVIGAFLSVLLTAAFLILRRLYKKIMV